MGVIFIYLYSLRTLEVVSYGIWNYICKLFECFSCGHRKHGSRHDMVWAIIWQPMEKAHGLYRQGHKKDEAVANAGNGSWIYHDLSYCICAGLFYRLSWSSGGTAGSCDCLLGMAGLCRD